jgi:ubiquinone/menaquinone biosynthesis C-methylase UbiE
VTTDSTSRRVSYNDPLFNYAQFWTGRDYEHESEISALRRLLGKRHYEHAADIGGGFGRLSVVLVKYANRVTLVDASSQQLSLSREIFPGEPFARELADASKLPFTDEAIDLAVMCRVLHHLPEPEPELAEIARILRPGGNAVIEVANSAHAARRVAAFLHGQRIPATPVDIRSEASRRAGNARYVNHHPDTITRQLAEAGLKVRRALSVSNFRHPLAKALVPQRALLAAERAVQQPLAGVRFGPSLFLMLEKQK